MSTPATIAPQVLLIGSFRKEEDEQDPNEVEAYASGTDHHIFRNCDRRVLDSKKSGLRRADHADPDTAIDEIRATAEKCRRLVLENRVWSIEKLCKRVDCVLVQLDESDFGTNWDWGRPAWKQFGEEIFRSHVSNESLAQTSFHSLLSAIQNSCGTTPTSFDFDNSDMGDAYATPYPTLPIIVFALPSSQTSCWNDEQDNTPFFEFEKGVQQQFKVTAPKWCEKLFLVRSLSDLYSKRLEENRTWVSKVQSAWGTDLKWHRRRRARPALRQYLISHLIEDEPRIWYERGAVDLGGLSGYGDGDLHNPRLRKRLFIYGRLAWLWRGLDARNPVKEIDPQARIPLRELVRNVFKTVRSANKKRFRELREPDWNMLDEVGALEVSISESEVTTTNFILGLLEYCCRSAASPLPSPFDFPAIECKTNEQEKCVDITLRFAPTESLVVSPPTDVLMEEESVDWTRIEQICSIFRLIPGEEVVSTRDSERLVKLKFLLAGSASEVDP